MNHTSKIQDMELEYKLLIGDFMKDLQRIGYPKHKAEQLQVFDKIIYWHEKMKKSIDELNDWLSAFGSGRSL